MAEKLILIGVKMKQYYDIDWLLKKIEDDQHSEFLLFWGHQNKSKNAIGKSCFSQWFELPFLVDGITYKTSEHWMMANKALLFEDLKIYNKIIEADKPGEAKALGRNVMGFDENIWNDKRYSIVTIGNIHKFNQHPEYAAFLKETGDKILVEASPVDTIWGIGLSQENEYAFDPYNWRGLNLLGFALMEVRDFLNEYGLFSNLENIVAPPWKLHPNIDYRDMYWRMGKGEDIVIKFSRYYSSLSERDKVIFELTNPTPYNWPDF
jgi:ribA/ribD-fused uncharacterized protein